MKWNGSWRHSNIGKQVDQIQFFVDLCPPLEPYVCSDPGLDRTARNLCHLEEGCPACNATYIAIYRCREGSVGFYWFTSRDGVYPP